jgi:hypothetical protein
MHVSEEVQGGGVAKCVLQLLQTKIDRELLGWYIFHDDDYINIFFFHVGAEKSRQSSEYTWIGRVRTYLEHYPTSCHNH